MPVFHFELAQTEGWPEIRILFLLTHTILHDVVKRSVETRELLDTFGPVRQTQNDTIQCLTET
jgi:hypothetical protein